MAGGHCGPYSAWRLALATSFEETFVYVKKTILLVVVVILVLVGALVFKNGYKSTTTPAPTPSIPGYQTPSNETPIDVPLNSLNKPQTINGVSITPLEVLEDSRCPSDVQCIWAGRVVVKANISKSSGNYTEVLELGKAVSTGTENITLTSVTPYPKAGESIAKTDYRFEFSVVPRTSTGGATKGCYVGGCSGQICSEEQGLASTCEWTEAYACFKTAKCEKQSTGKCGWTETPTLQMCLNNAKGQ